jgi:hypothetical protein
VCSCPMSCHENESGRQSYQIAMHAQERVRVNEWVQVKPGKVNRKRRERFKTAADAAAVFNPLEDKKPAAVIAFDPFEKERAVQ